MERSCLGLVFLAFGLLGVCTGEINVRYDIGYWNEARDGCQKQVNFRSCDLVSRTRLQEDWDKLDLSGGDTYWVGGRSVYRWMWDEGDGVETPLFQHRGCYKWEIDEVAEGSAVDYNAPHRCNEACSGAFFYLRGDYCICSDTLKGEQVSRAECNQTCDGSDVKCGGDENYFSVYSLPQKVRFSDSAGSRLCASAQMRSDVLEIENTDCERNLHYFCSSDLQANQINYRSEKYDAAVSRCRDDHNSSFPTPSSYADFGQYLSDLEALNTKYSTSSFTTFWLPLRRRVKTLWVDGQAKEGGEVGRCLAAEARNDGYNVIDLPCSRSHAAICECSKSVGGGGDGNNDNSGNKDKKLGPSKAIIAVVVVVVALVVVCAVLFFVVWKRRMASRRGVGYPQE